MKKRISLFLALCLACSALAGCGSKETTSAPQTIDDVEAAVEEKAPEAEAEKVLADAQELTFVLNNEPDGIDPTITNNSFANVFLNNLFEGLVTYAEDGSIVAANAESWTSNDDLTVYTFKLREGLKWSDGTPLTANDYVYSALRVMNPATGSQYSYMMTDYLVNGAEFFAGEASAEEVGVKALDDLTLEFTLKEPCPYFVDLVSMWVYFPVQAATVDANGDKWTASADTYVCNGPFMIEEINMGESYVLVKNENYWDADSVTLEKLNLRFVLDLATALTAYESEEVDGVRTVQGSEIARLKAEDKGVRSVTNYGTVYYDINNTKEPYNNPLVRKALNLAIDREALINNVDQVDAQAAFSFLAPGYVVNGVDVTEGRSDFELSANANVEAAQAALAEAGYPNGEGFPTVQLSYYTDDGVKKRTEAIAEMWETNLGIEVEVSSADWGVFYSDIQAGNFEVGAMGWSADYTNPMSFMPLLYTDNPNNNSKYSNTEYDALVDQIKVENDPAKFAELVQQADELASAEYPVMPIYYKVNTYLLDTNIEGVFMVASSNLYFKNAKVYAE